MTAHVRPAHTTPASLCAVGESWHGAVAGSLYSRENAKDGGDGDTGAGAANSRAHACAHRSHRSTRGTAAASVARCLRWRRSCTAYCDANLLFCLACSVARLPCV